MNREYSQRPLEDDMKIEIRKYSEAEDFICPIGFEITARMRANTLLDMLKGENAFSTCEEFLFSDVEWSLWIKRTTSDYLSFFLHCSNHSPEFSCFVRAKLVLITERPHVPRTILTEKEFDTLFNSDAKDGGCSEFVRWEELRLTESGFASDGEFIFMVEVWAEPPPRKWWSSKQRTGYVGLADDGTVSPYLSSILQILFFTRQLRSAVYVTPSSSRYGERAVTRALQRIFFELEFSEEVVWAAEFFKRVGKRNVLAYGYEEYLRFLMVAVKYDMKNTKHEDVLSNLFEGKTNTLFKCENVDCESSICEPFYEINLTVEGNSNIYEALSAFIAAERLEGDCKYDAGEYGLQEATKFVKFETLPPVLHIHLKRFRYDTAEKRVEKINSRIEFYEKIDLAQYAKFENEVDTEYTLHAVLVHSNENHRNPYFVYISPENDGIWFKFDGSVVCRVRTSEAIEGNYGYAGDGDGRNAVMLVYVKGSEFARIMRPGEKLDVFQIDECSPMEVCLRGQADFSSLLDDECFSDVSILVDDVRSYKCHRLFLTCESRYFKHKFDGENDAREIDLRAHRFDAEAFGLVLRYIYGERCVVTLQTICAAFKVCVFLRISSLQRRFVGFLRKKKHVNKMYEMFKIAKEMDDPEPLDSISSSILNNRDFLVNSSVSCLNLEEIIFLIAKGNKVMKNRKYLLECALKWAVEAESGADSLADVLLEIDLKTISVHHIIELSKAEYIEQFKNTRNRDIMLVSPILQRLLSGDNDLTCDQDNSDDTPNIIGDNINDDDIEDISDNSLYIFKARTNYSHLISTGKFSDTNVRVNSQVFKFHRPLLAGYSKFFHAIYKDASNYVENENKEVKLTLDCEAFAEIIHLIYSGTFVITSNNITKLIEASDFLDVDDALDKCTEYTRDNLVFDNAIDVFAIAYQHDKQIAIANARGIILANIRYLTSMGFLTDFNMPMWRLLLKSSRDHSNQADHLYAILKWVTADADRSQFLGELLSALDLSSMSRNDVCRIFNANTDDAFRSTHVAELRPLLERLLCAPSVADTVRNEANAIYLALSVGNRYVVKEWAYNFHREDAIPPREGAEKAFSVTSKSYAVFENEGTGDLKIGVSGKVIHALTWQSRGDMYFKKLHQKISKRFPFHSICAPGDRPMFRVPQYLLEFEKYHYYVIPGLTSFTVFSDLYIAVFYIFNERNSRWESKVLRQRSLFPKHEKLLVAGENNKVVLTGTSHSDFKLVDIGTNSIINIPKPQFLKDDAAITLLNHRLYVFSFHNNLRKSAMFDLFTNEWTILPDIVSPVDGILRGRLQAVAVGNCLQVFETRQFQDDKTNCGVSNKCFNHHFNLDNKKWSSGVVIKGAVVLHAISAYTDYP